MNKANRLTEGHSLFKRCFGAPKKNWYHVKNMKKLHGFDLKDGVTRKQLVKSIIKSGELVVPKGMSQSEFIDKRENDIHKLKGINRFETKYTNGNIYAGFFTKLSDGNYTQIMDDITDLKEKEKQALDAEKRLQDAIDSMPHGKIKS